MPFIPFQIWPDVLPSFEAVGSAFIVEIADSDEVGVWTAVVGGGVGAGCGAVNRETFGFRGAVCADAGEAYDDGFVFGHVGPSLLMWIVIVQNIVL